MMKKTYVVFMASILSVFLITLASCTYTSEQSCIFCSIIKGTAPSLIIEQDAYVVAFEKNPPRDPVDCLIVPRKHIENVKSFDFAQKEDREIVVAMFAMAQKLAKKLTGSQDFQLHINNGAEVGQTVHHLHMHFKSLEHWKK